MAGPIYSFSRGPILFPVSNFLAGPRTTGDIKVDEHSTYKKNDDLIMLFFINLFY
jgi:hypothetical protein